MSQPQSAICAEGGAFGIFVTMLLSDGGEAKVKQAAAALPALTARLAAETQDPALVSSLAFGATAWPRLFTAPAPKGLAPFQALEAGERKAPATPADLFLHIHAARPDSAFQLARQAMCALRGAVTLVEEINGFRTLGNRDLTGFVDGTENPQGDERAEVALLGEDDPTHAGGSFVSLQRWLHALPRWDSLPIAEQEAAVGRSKADNEEMDDETKPASAHIARVVIEEDGEELELLRHSLPYGNSQECGLYFVAYAKSPHPFRRMLESMVLGDGQGHYDRLMDFTRPVTGAAFFAPSIPALERLAAEPA